MRIQILISGFKGLTVRKFSLQNVMYKISTVPNSIQWKTLLLVVYLLYFSFTKDCHINGEW